jgi:hypothetical protein
MAPGARFSHTAANVINISPTMPIPNSLADFAELQKERFIDSGMLQDTSTPAHPMAVE